MSSTPEKYNAPPGEILRGILAMHDHRCARKNYPGPCMRCPHHRQLSFVQCMGRLLLD